MALEDVIRVLSSLVVAAAMEMNEPEERYCSLCDSSHLPDECPLFLSDDEDPFRDWGTSTDALRELRTNPDGSLPE